jgi:hypothetical protein
LRHQSNGFRSILIRESPYWFPISMLCDAGWDMNSRNMISSEYVEGWGRVHRTKLHHFFHQGGSALQSLTPASATHIGGG